MNFRLIGLATATIAACALAACTSSSAGKGHGSDAASRSSSATTSASSTDSAAAPASDTTGSAPATAVTVTATVTTTPPGPASCTNAQLGVTSSPPPAGDAAGHEGVVLLFRNQGSADCSLTGYPGVAGLDSSGHQVQQATRTLTGMLGGCSCTAAPTLTLHPGDTVSAVVEATPNGGGPCTAFASLLVTPPNTTASTPIAAGLPSCGFDVHPVVTGQSGGGPTA